MIKEIELDIEVSRASGVIASELDDEIVMMSIEQGEYYGLGQIGSKIWLLIEQPKKVKELIKLLTEKYDVEDKQCQHDVCSFLTQLHEKRINSLCKLELCQNTGFRYLSKYPNSFITTL